jgi:phosphoglycolate phosphatase
MDVRVIPGPVVFPAREDALSTRYDVVFFDLEGTLFDPGPGIIEAARFALLSLGIREGSPYRLRRLVGPPLEKAFSLYYGLGRMDAEKAADYLLQHYMEYGLEDNRLYEGVESMLQRLRQARTGLVAMSCGDNIYVSRLMRRFGLTSMFITFRGGSVGNSTSKRRILRDILNELPVLEGKSMVSVGDREDDVLAARDIGMPCIAVSYGFGSAEELKNAGPDRIVGSVEELTRALLP